MAKKYVVWVSYGVYVDTDLDAETDDGYALIKRQAVDKMFSHGHNEVIANAEIEVEDVSAEFAEDF